MKITAAIIIFSLFLFFGSVSAAEKIDINTAPLEELVKIIHIGGARAKELISLRPFSSLDDLARIKGIGEARAKDIKEQGIAWVDEKWLEARPLTKAAEDGSPQTLQTIELSGDSNNYTLLAAAIFTSLSGGVMILLIKKKIKT